MKRKIKENDQDVNLSDAVIKIIDSVKLMHEDLSKLAFVVSSFIETQRIPTIQVPPPEPTSSQTNIAIVQTVETPKYPIPVEFREATDLILNKKFEIEIDYLPDVASFQFSVLVPREYSNAGNFHWETHKEDRRSKIIENAMGINGVREWSMKIYENLSSEIRSKIFYDRTQPV